MSTTETTALSIKEETSHELAVTSQQAMAAKEVEAAIIVARRFPRDEDYAFARVMKSCERWKFASMTTYSYPRNEVQVKGPTVNLAREIARCWGNIRYGADVVYDDEDTRTIRAWAWDVETNTRESQDVNFAKKIFRKGKGWVTPDERDLRELTNKQGAVAVRNCILHLVPPDLVDDAMSAAQKAMSADAAKDPDEARKKLVKAFSTIGVRPADLEIYLGHPVRQITPDETADLRSIWKSINDDNSTWAEYIAGKVDPDKPANMEELKQLLTKKPEPKQEEPEPELTHDETEDKEAAIERFSTDFTKMVEEAPDDGALFDIESLLIAASWLPEADSARLGELLAHKRAALAL